MVYADCAPVTLHRRVIRRLTVLRAAKDAILMISGQEKQEIFTAVMNEPPDTAWYSLQLLWPIFDRVTWFINSAAASR